MKRIIAQAMSKHLKNTHYNWWNDGTVDRQTYYHKREESGLISTVMGMPIPVDPPVEWNDQDFGKLCVIEEGKP